MLEDLLKVALDFISEYIDNEILEMTAKSYGFFKNSFFFRNNFFFKKSLINFLPTKLSAFDKIETEKIYNNDNENEKM